MGISLTGLTGDSSSTPSSDSNVNLHSKYMPPFRKASFRDPFIAAFGEPIELSSGDTIIGIIDHEIAVTPQGASLIGGSITVLRIREELDKYTTFTWQEQFYQIDAKQEIIDEQGLNRYVCSRRRVR